MPDDKPDSTSSEEKPSVTLPGTVEKVIKPMQPDAPEVAQISVEGAQDLYKELRVENVVTDEHGNELKMKPGAKVEVTIEADPKDVVPAPAEKQK